MILYNPYDLKLLKVINLKDTIYSIDKYITMDYAYLRDKEKIKLKPFKDDITTLTPVILYGLTSIEKEITPFNHPLINQDSKWIALDLRNVVSLTKDKENYEIRNQAEYDLIIQRFILTGIWYIGKQSELYSLKFPQEVFSSWLSENISKKFGLDLNDQIKLKILSNIYYSTMFKEEFTKDDFSKLIIRLTKENIPEKLIIDTYNKVESLNSLNDFITSTYTVTNNIRLKKLDYVGLVTTLINTWFGNNNKELIMLSLEHPPTWISLIYASLFTRTYSKSYIASLTEKLNRRKKGEDFLKELISITKNYRV